MRRNGEESGKKNRVTGLFVPVLTGSLLALGLVFLLVLAIAGLIWSGTLSASTPSIALSFCMAVSAFAGGRFAIGKGSEPVVTGVLTGAVLAGSMMILCLLVSGGIVFHGRFFATILLILAGGALSGLMGGKKKRKKKKKK